MGKARGSVFVYNEGAHREEERLVHIDPYTALGVNSLVQLEKAIVVHAVVLDLALKLFMMFRPIQILSSQKLKREQWRPMKRHDYVIQESVHLSRKL